MELERIEKNGATYVMVPESLYNRMTESAETLNDIYAFDAAISREEEGFPIAFGEKLSAAYHEGSSLIPLWREYRGMTQQALALRAGIKQPYLSAIESGKKPGSVKAMAAIAVALGISIDDLV